MNLVDHLNDTYISIVDQSFFMGINHYHFFWLNKIISAEQND